MAWVVKKNNSPVYYIAWRENGKRRLKSTGTKNKSLAKKYAEAKTAESKDKKILVNKDNLLLSQAFVLFIRDRKNEGKELSELTIDNYNRAIKIFYQACGDKPVSEYSREDYHSFIGEMEHSGQNTKSIYSRCVFALFRWCVIEKYLKDNPVKRVAEVQKEFRIISSIEMRAILDYAGKTKFNNLVKFMALSAFRINEALNLKYSDFVLTKKYIKVKGKGSKYASIPIIDEMSDFIATLLPFPGDKDQKVFPFTDDGVYRFWQRLRKQGFRDDVTSHDLRKYCLSEMANSGCAMNFVQKYARHNSILTTMKYYIRTDDGRLVKEVNKKVKLLKQYEKTEKK